MEGVWFKQCPQCRNYLKKSDPQEAGMCCACGWEEYVTKYYCDIVNQYCTATLDANMQNMPNDLIDRIHVHKK